MSGKRGRRSIALLLLVLSSAAGVSAAAPLPAPDGRVILTVGGRIDNTNDGNRAVFDREMLEAMGTSSLEVTTPWTEGRQKFEGVLGRKVLDAVGARGETIIARALNDYRVSIPLSDLRRYPVLFALKHNGEYMRVRDKGPVWIIYPRDDYPDLDTDQITDRWVWQLTEITIE